MPTITRSKFRTHIQRSIDAAANLSDDEVKALLRVADTAKTFTVGQFATADMQHSCPLTQAGLFNPSTDNEISEAQHSFYRSFDQLGRGGELYPVYMVVD